MKSLRNTKIILLILLLLAGLLRFYGISHTAPALNWDEAALGYNSYSLSIDGRDEFGKLLPLQYLESYGDYKPVVYSYLGAVPVRLFGLNEFGVRFPSAILGVLTVLLTYFLVKEIFPKKDKKTEVVALVSAFLLAVSPWHIMLSRGAYEASVSQFFIVLGILLFLKAINKNPWLLILAAISLIVSFYTFNTARVFVPLIVIVMGIAFRKTLLKNIKQSIVTVVIGLIIIAPLIPFLISPQAKLRFHEVNIFSNLEVIETSNQYIENDENAWWSSIIHNRRVLYGLEFVKHYFDNLNPRFLFITGDGNPRFSTQDVGQLYLLELPFLIAGAFLLIRKKEGHFWIIPVWFLLGIIPAATARETPHALRIETVIPTLQIIAAYGFVSVCLMIKRLNYRKFFVGVCGLIILLNTLYFMRGLLTHYAREYSSEWQYPYKEVVSYVNQNYDKYENIVMTDKLGRPYIYFLLYNKVHPDEFRKSAKIEREVFGFVHVKGFDKFRFEKEINEVELSGRTLYIDVPSENQGEIIKEFKLLNGDIALVSYEKN